MWQPARRQRSAAHSQLGRGHQTGPATGTRGAGSKEAPSPCLGVLEDEATGMGRLRHCFTYDAFFFGGQTGTLNTAASGTTTTIGMVGPPMKF
ncbi:hypothetical protein NDU88_011887 [Pleurodeles waltl]|uniref:Uncharacterized protein n=1 Tax=Pleurodeles waltl TaxID=8319 RepID=A0AAV7S410_PLEWA|nr:hypothetical protein NDU88_011887 [Pleurodeles waltl]